MCRTAAGDFDFSKPLRKTGGQAGRRFVGRKAMPGNRFAWPFAHLAT